MRLTWSSRRLGLGACGSKKDPPCNSAARDRFRGRKTYSTLLFFQGNGVSNSGIANRLIVQEKYTNQGEYPCNS